MDNIRKKIIKNSNLFFLLIILLIGTFFRTFWLSKSPPSLNWDETALGYNAYSLLKTAKDEYGFKLPLTFRSFDDYKPPLYPYMIVPFVATFGLNEIAVRLPSALAGISSIIAIYLIASLLFNKKVGLFASILFAVEPWSVLFSRVAFETNLGLAFVLWGLYFSLKVYRINQLIYLSIIFLGLSSFSYHSYRVLIIPLIILVLILNRKILKDKRYLAGISILLVILITSLILIIKSGGGLVRLEATSIFRVVRFDLNSNTIGFLNQIYLLGKNIIGRYFSYFSPANLFVRGTNEPNQQIHGFSEFYAIEFVFFILGIISLAKNKFMPRIFTALILLSPLPAIITWNWFLPARVLLLFSMYSILIGLGINFGLSLIKNFKKSLFLSLIFIVTVIFLNNLGELATTIFLYLPYMERGNWQYGFREIMNYITPIQDNYNKIIFETGHAQPHIFVLFYGKYDPVKYHMDIVCPDCVEKPRKNFNFGKYEFRNIYWPVDRSLKNTLFIGSEYSLPEKDIKTTQNARILSNVNDELGNFIARVVEIK